MSDKYFIDTNVWLYGFMKDDERHKTASLLIAGDNVVLSTQVLNEISFNLIKKAGYEEIDISKLIKNIYRKFDVLKPNEETILSASLIRRKYNVQFWDSIKIAIALNNKCRVLFTDKFNNGFLIEDKIKLINPFEG